MLKPIKILLKDNMIYIAIVVTVAIIYLSLAKLPKTIISVRHIDKFYHSLAYFTLTLSWLLSFYKKPKSKYLIIILCIILGIVIEILQAYLTIYRTGDYLDILANTIGVFLAFFIFNLFLKKNSIN